MMTPVRARAIAEYVVLSCAEREVRTALLEYADMVERCEKLRFNMIPHKHDTEIVDYILRGDAGKEK